MPQKTSKRAASQSHATIPGSQSSSDNENEEPKLYKCTCSKYCGILGKDVPQSTFSRHQRIEQGLEPPKSKKRRKQPPKPVAISTRQEPVSNPEDSSSGRIDDEDNNTPLDNGDADSQGEYESPRPHSDPPASPPTNPTDEDDSDKEEEPPLDQPDNPSPEEVEASFNEFKITNKFIDKLRNASLDDETEKLDTGLIERLRNPPRGVPELDSDERLALDIFLSITNASVETYNSVHAAILRRYPDSSLMSYHRVKKLVAVLSGIDPIMHDMCVNSCIGYTGPFSDLLVCTSCGEPRYDPEYTKAQVPRKQFQTFPLGPQLQALRRSPEGATELRYRQRHTEEVLAELEDSGGIKISPYTDFFDGSDYLDAVEEGKIKEHDMVLFTSIDGAQLYRNKTSDCWIAVWIVADRPIQTRYKKRGILPQVIIPGPGKPKNIDSFVYPGFYHLSALQHEGLKVWDALDDEVYDCHPFLALECADGPGMAALSGCVGHHGKKGCRVYCPMTGRHKVGGSHYYPVRFKPHNYNVNGCDHEDIHLGPLLDGFDPEQAAERYKNNVKYVGQARNKTDYEKRRLETGISKPCILSGLPARHTLGLPASFGLDFMHAPALNLPDLMINLWRGKFECSRSDSVDDWDWAVLTGETWKQHGQAVADTTKYIPGSFDRPPRNIAEKISSGYKAWEFMLYFYGLGPALLFGILPDRYYENYCQSVRAIRLLVQEEISPEDLLESHQMASSFSDGFELLYVQRRADRLHFVRPIIHTLSHMAPETARKGPGNIYSQWALERTIGNLGQEIRQHSNPYANLSQRALQRCQVNALLAIIPDLEPVEDQLPQGALDIGGGYRLLCKQDSCARTVRECEEEAIRDYIESEFGQDIADGWYGSVVRWARIQLPTGQIARSSWNEGEESRFSRHVKLKVESEGVVTAFAEILFYFILSFDEEERYVALASFFSEPNPYLLQLSHKTYWSFQHLRDTKIRVVEIKDITDVVIMAPDHQYATRYSDGSEIDRWHMVQKPGRKLACPPLEVTGMPMDVDV